MGWPFAVALVTRYPPTLVRLMKNRRLVLFELAPQKRVKVTPAHKRKMNILLPNQEPFC